MSEDIILAVVAGAAVSPVLAFFLLAARRAVAKAMGSVFGWFFVSHMVYGEGSAAIQDYFRKNGSLFSAGASAVWNLKYVFIRPEGSRRHLFHRNSGDSNAIMIHHGWPIFHLRWAEQNGGYNSRYFFLRGTVDWQEILRAVQADHSKQAHSNGMRYRVQRFYGSAGFGLPGGDYSGKAAYNGSSAVPSAPEDDKWVWSPLDFSAHDIGAPNPPDPFRHLALGPEAKRVIRDAKFWLDHADWYQEREIPWRWGCLLKGAPGTGKTSLARSIAQSLDLPIVIADLSSMSNRDISERLRGEVNGITPCMLVLEDIDTVFNGRENVTDSQLTFDALLNFLDGVEGLDGVLTFVTTNRPETLDAALTRPGRLDSHVELPGLDADGRLRVARLILQNDTEAAALAKAAPDKESPAEFKERCCRRARDILWASQ